MKTKIKGFKSLLLRGSSQQPTINTLIQSAVKRKISSYLEVMGDPRLRSQHFHLIENKDIRSSSLQLSTDDVTISFTVQWKGGIR